MTKRKVGVINLAPTPEGYARALLTVVENHPDPIERAWARSEIVNAFRVAALQHPEAWGQPLKGRLENEVLQ